MKTTEDDRPKETDVRPDRSHRRAVLAIALVLASSGIVACTGADDTPGSGRSNSKPVNAEQVVAARCRGCHSASIALEYRTTSRDAAKEMVESMERRGVFLFPEERQILIDHFLR